MNKNTNTSFPDKDWSWFDGTVTTDTSPIRLPSALYFLWGTIMDLQKRYDITDISGQVGLISWWQTNGTIEYPDLEITVLYDKVLYEPAEAVQYYERYPINRILLATVQLNKPFLNELSLDQESDRIRLYNWYYKCIVPSTHSFSPAEILFFSEAAPDVIQDVYLPITHAMMFGWHDRNDLQAEFDLTKKVGRMGFEAWWLRGGYKEVAPYTLVEKQRLALYETASDIAQDTLLPITRAMMLCWHGRNDLQAGFDLTKKAGRLGFEAWWLRGGYKEVAPYTLAEKQRLALYETASDIEQDTLLPITRAMMLCWHGRNDLQAGFDLTKKAGRLGFEAWWLRGGYKEVAPYTLAEKQLQALFEDAPDIEQDTVLPITRVMMICWYSRSDLQVAFDLALKQGRLEFEHWWEQNKNQLDFNYTDSVAHSNNENNSINIYNETRKGDEPVKDCSGYIPQGVNLVGLVKGELGIGEDLRMAARAMGKANIKFSVFNYPRKSSSRQSDLSFAHLVHDELIYNINMVNLTGFEHANIFSQYGKKFFDKRFTIGAWPWELPVWPKLCENVFNLADEIWASSRYAEQAYSNSPVPVVYMPMTVDFDSVPVYERSDFGLKQDKYLFLYVFDGLSYMARKNPIAHIKAFWSAFPRSQKDVGLVVKTMNVNLDNEIWNTFHKMAASDDRISVIAETLSKDKVLGLMNNCDAFLSLHRAEGFGRCIAEMMWLGKPVIVTNFSGNTDYTTSKTAFLVDGPLIKIRDGEYPYGEGQYWCDPDVGAAAEHMRTCYQGGSEVNMISAAGKAHIKRNYSVETVAGKYKERLKQLGI